MKNLKDRLLDGEVVEFESENDMLSIFRRMALCGNKKYFIELNGKLIKDAKTFKTIKRNLDEKINEFGLTEQV